MSRWHQPGSESGHHLADLALYGMLAYWTNCDQEQMNRLFRRSALFRSEKWDRLADSATGESYGQKTIRMAAGTERAKRQHS